MLRKLASHHRKCFVLFNARGISFISEWDIPLQPCYKSHSGSRLNFLTVSTKSKWSCVAGSCVLCSFTFPIRHMPSQTPTPHRNSWRLSEDPDVAPPPQPFSAHQGLWCQGPLMALTEKCTNTSTWQVPANNDEYSSVHQPANIITLKQHR